MSEKLEQFQLEEASHIKQDGLGLTVATMFLAGTMAGSGVLTLSKAMVEIGPLEMGMIIFFALNAAFVGIRLGYCWVMLGERFPEFRDHCRDPYPSIAEKATGTIGRAMAVTCINFTLYGGGCVFIVLMASFTQNLLKGIGLEMTFCNCMVVVACAMIPPCWLGTPNDFWPLAVGALLTTVVACLMIMIQLPLDVNSDDRCFAQHFYNSLNTTEDAYLQYTGVTPNYPAPTFMGFFRAFASTMFAFAGAPNFPTIQADMKDKHQFKTATVIAMTILLLIYGPMAGVGYGILGDLVSTNIVHDLCDGPVKVTVEILLLLHLVSAFPIVVNPSNQFFEGLIGIPKTFTWKRCVFRSIVVFVLLFISVSIPSFGSILDLVGGSTVTLLTFVFPPFFYMRLADMASENPSWKQRNIGMLERAYCWFVIAVGLCGCICSSGVSLLNIAFTNFHPPCYIDSNIGVDSHSH